MLRLHRPHLLPKVSTDRATKESVSPDVVPNDLRRGREEDLGRFYRQLCSCAESYNIARSLDFTDFTHQAGRNDAAFYLTNHNGYSMASTTLAQLFLLATFDLSSVRQGHHYRDSHAGTVLNVLHPLLTYVISYHNLLLRLPIVKRVLLGHGRIISKISIY